MLCFAANVQSRLVLIKTQQTLFTNQNGLRLRMRIAFDSALKWVDLLPWLGGDMRADSREGQGSFTSFMTYIVKITFFQHSSTTWAITHRGFMDLRALD